MTSPLNRVALRTLAGPDAGRELIIGVGRHVVGRGRAVDLRLDDPALACRQAVLELDALGHLNITDLAPPRPSRLDGVVLDGVTAIAEGQRVTMGCSVIEVATGSPPVQAGPPRPALGPARLDAASWTLGAGLWPRSRGRSRGKADRRRDRESVARFAAELAAHQREVAEHRRRNTMELADAVDCARGGGTQLWARRSDDPDAYRAVVGRGEQVARPALVGERGRVPEDAWALVEAASVLVDVPIGVELGPGAVVGVVGPRVIADAVVRSLVLQLVVAHGPAHLLVAGLLSPVPTAGEVSWLRWLPHAKAPSTGEALIGTGPEVSVVLGDLDRPRWGAPPEEGWTGDRQAHLLLVVHDPGLLAVRDAAARQLLASDPSVAALIVADEVADLPSLCRIVVEVRADATAAIHRPGQAELAEQVVIAGASAATAQQVAQALAGLHDPEQPFGSAAVPSSVSPTARLGPDMTDPARSDRARLDPAGWRGAG